MHPFSAIRVSFGSLPDGLSYVIRIVVCDCFFVVEFGFHYAGAGTERAHSQLSIGAGLIKNRSILRKLYVDRRRYSFRGIVSS